MELSPFWAKVLFIFSNSKCEKESGISLKLYMGYSFSKAGNSSSKLLIRSYIRRSLFYQWFNTSPCLNEFWTISNLTSTLQNKTWWYCTAVLKLCVSKKLFAFLLKIYINKFLKVIITLLSLQYNLCCGVPYTYNCNLVILFQPQLKYSYLNICHSPTQPQLKLS